MLTDQLFMTQLVSFLSTLFEGLVSMALFALSYRRRKRFPLRCALCAAAGLVLALLSALGMYASGAGSDAAAIAVRIALSLAMNLFLLAFLFICWEEPAAETILCWSMGIAATNIAGQGYALILNSLGVDDSESISLFGNDPSLWYDFALMALFHVAVFALLALLFARRSRLHRDRRTSVNVALIAFTVTFATTGLGSFTRVFEGESLALAIATKLYRVLCSLFVILLALGVFQQSRLGEDMDVTRQMLAQEQRRYEISRENIEAVNMKCHDLKHRLSSIEDRLTGEETAALREAIEIYDSNIRTGNEVLDVVLHEKQMFCRKNGLTISCVADGALLSFMSPSHLYSLLSNALDNAIEAELPLQDPAERSVDLSVGSENGCAVIEISNWFEGERELEDGLPVTTKEDKGRHGYGMKSMRYIAGLYGGTLEAQIWDRVFLLRAVFPRKE